MTLTERKIWIATYSAAMALSGNRPDVCAYWADKAVEDIKKVHGDGVSVIRAQIRSERDNP